MITPTTRPDGTPTNAARLAEVEIGLATLTEDTGSRLSAIEDELAGRELEPPGPLTEQQLYERMLRNGATEEMAAKNAAAIFDNLEGRDGPGSVPPESTATTCWWQLSEAKAQSASGRGIQGGAAPLDTTPEGCQFSAAAPRSGELGIAFPISGRSASR